MTVIVRDLHTQDPADVENFTRARHLALPHVLWTPAGVIHRTLHTDPAAHYRSLVAEEDGEVIGTAQLGLAHDSPEPGQGYLNIYVRPDRVRRGAGDLLVRTAEEHLAAHGATRLYSWVLDEPHNRAFAERHGYRAGRSAHFLRLDLRNGTLPPRRPLPPGVELRSAADFAHDPRPFFELDAETTLDEPSDVDTEFTDYEVWVEENWKHPLLDHALTTVALVDGRPAAFSAAHTDGTGRYATAMTGTARAFRGRGLAKLAKNDSLHRARAAGCTEALTGNDAGNEPMLAINKWFGYEIRATEVRHVRELS
ncbi:GNAT family N-acetyltransferase [Streptomyces griseorubiginosus]|uniref:GNAT family N-acetyltransferase n=1 Tax=Streptomyces griseorubiginosus TaxID=67304 RepID=UPI00114017BA|nr:GNAT family N-acetyltransferase [Streptomyces griseorubiginosus]